jgi:hypothetical protein
LTDLQLSYLIIRIGDCHLIESSKKDCTIKKEKERKERGGGEEEGDRTN